ncbi:MULTISPECIES: PRC-barrel domain-containing protein [unclassified Streptomyces]|uniref:PRC-barrel domain-containing protein n=1 Tax=unclassified Streptomyces TaxID=2593676 RepID=UPI000DB8F90A|nr:MULTISPECIES: PRC-barrel domain-containing protein [unclassified Streptomyces]MYT68639.1 PRC-barrel domain containing protein [Streptomyces sp. SID8367]RAJ86311.1 PRC-barrel domain protein [Streptomyces sp. PsTaAH-137]
MFVAENIRDWRDQDVVDAEGHKIGTLESVYVDTSDDRPSFAAVTIGLPTRKRITFVPLGSAKVAPSYVKVAWPKQKVKDAPSIDTDGELTAEMEPELFGYYGLQGVPGGPRRLARR